MSGQVPLCVKSSHWQGADIAVHLPLLPDTEADVVNGTHKLQFLSSSCRSSFGTRGHEEDAQWTVSAYHPGDASIVHVECAGDVSHGLAVPERLRMEVAKPDGEVPSSGVVFMEWASDREPLHKDCVDGDLHFIFKARLPLIRQAGFVSDDTIQLRISFVWKEAQENTRVTPSHKIGCTFDSHDFSDMEVVVKGSSFNLHRNILASQSPVFRSMISANMSETLRGRLEITDMGVTIARAFFRYLYTGEVKSARNSDEIPEVVTGLWYDMYSLGSSAAPSVLDLTFSARDLSAAPSVLDLTFSARDLEQHSQVWVDWVDKISWGLLFHGGHVPEMGEHGGHLLDQYDAEAQEWSDSEDATASLTDGRWYFQDCFGVQSTFHCKGGELQFAQFWGQLLAAADKYCVDDLASLCAERMLQRLSIWSAIPMLASACHANQHGLKRGVINFITLTPDIFGSVRDMAEYDSLDENVRSEIVDAFVEKQLPGGKRPRPGGPWEKEFADGQDWARLSLAQLRRACSERGVATGGSREEMAALLRAQEDPQSP